MILPVMHGLAGSKSEKRGGYCARSGMDADLAASSFTVYYYPRSAGSHDQVLVRAELRFLQMRLGHWVTPVDLSN